MAVEACPLLPPPHLLRHLYHLGVGTDVSLGGRPLQVLPVGQRLLSLEEGRSWPVVGPSLRTDLFCWLGLATRGAQRQQLGWASAGGAHAGILWTLVEVDVLVIPLLLPCGATRAL